MFGSRPVGALAGGFSAALDDEELIASAMLRRGFDGLSRASCIHAARPDISSSRCAEDLAPCPPNLYL